MLCACIEQFSAKWFSLFAMPYVVGDCVRMPDILKWRINGAQIWAPFTEHFNLHPSAISVRLYIEIMHLDGNVKTYESFSCVLDCNH